MSDSLEDFIRQNREGFDGKTPSQDAWGKIESHLPAKTKSLWNSVVLWRSAAILLLGVCAYLFFAPIGKANRLEQANIKGEFKDLESFYGGQIAEKKELVSQFQSETGSMADEVTQNLQKLEAMYQVLKDEMEKRPSQDVKDALVLNLLVRIDLLNQQLNKLDRQTNEAEVVSS